MKHQRTLQQKRVSKEKDKAKSLPIADDSASNVSVDSVSIPVVILPIDAQSVDIDDNIGNIDNVVEFQQPQPEGPPPPPSIVFDAGTLSSVFQKQFFSF